MDLSFTLKMVWKRKSDISPLESGPVHPHIRKVKYPLQDCVGVSISWNNDTKKPVNIYELFDSVVENSQSSQIAANEPEKFESYWNSTQKSRTYYVFMDVIHVCLPQKNSNVHVFFLFFFIILGQRQLHICFGKQRWNCIIHHHQTNCFT